MNISVLANYTFTEFLECNLYICKQSLMIAYEGTKYARDNFGEFIYQLQPKTKTLVGKLESIQIKLHGQNVSLLFNLICLNESQQPTYKHSHTCMCVCAHARVRVCCVVLSK